MDTTSLDVDAPVCAGPKPPTRPVAPPVYSQGQMTPDLALAGLYGFTKAIYEAATREGAQLLDAFIGDEIGADWQLRTYALLWGSQQAMSEAQDALGVDGCAFSPPENSPVILPEDMVERGGDVLGEEDENDPGSLED